MSPLLNLPAELRLAIYTELLLCPSALCNSSDDSDCEWRQKASVAGEKGPKPSLFPAVLQTCRTVYREACSILYRKNVFVFHNRTGLERFLERIGVRNSSRIRHLCMSIAVFSKGWPRRFDAICKRIPSIVTLELYFCATSGVSKHPGGRYSPLDDIAPATRHLRALRKIVVHYIPSPRLQPQIDGLFVGSMRHHGWVVVGKGERPSRLCVASSGESVFEAYGSISKCRSDR